MGIGLSNRFELTGRTEDLEEAIRVFRQAVEATPSGHPELAGHLNNLGIGLRNRFGLIGHQGDLEEAIQVFRQGVETTPSGYPELAVYLNNLGTGLSNRFGLTGRNEDLEEAIRVFRQAVEATPPGHPDLVMYLNNLGIGLRDRFGRTGRREDLEEAVQVFRQGVEVTPSGHPDLAMYLNNLGSGLSNRFERTGLTEDLEEAIRVFRQAVEATPPGHPDLAMYLNNLSNGLSNRFGRTGRQEDLEEAIDVLRQAVKATPPGHPNLAGYLSNLGNGLSDRFGRIGRQEDLEEAIDVLRQAVKATPPGHPNLAGYLNNLGNGLRNRFERTGRTEDLEEGIESFRKACGFGLLAAIEETLRSGRNWQRWAFQRSSWAEVVEAYDFVEKGMQRRLSQQFRRADKSFSLGGVQGLVAQASYAQLKLGRPGQAVEALEGGRTLLMREALERQRRDLYLLKELGYADLYQDFMQASGRYDALLAQESEARPSDWMQQLEGASEMMQSAAESIRQIAGAEHPRYRFFLKPLLLPEIQEQAHDAPLVYLAATPAGGMALIVNATSIKEIDLPELTDESLRKTLAGTDEKVLGGYLGSYIRWRNGDSNAFVLWWKSLDETTHWLWDTVMGRVLASLEAEEISEAVLIPTGLLGLLPLHAAWTKDSSLPVGRRYALDDCTFTFAPSAQVLYHARLGADRPADTLLAVENPDGTLKFTEPEVRSVLSHFPGISIHLLRDQATKKQVVQAVGSSSVLHFSGHGLAGWLEAESSGIKLADGYLTLMEIFDLNLDQARLAVLSACETGVPGTKLPDEAVSLPSAWMQAGVPGVVGSLWSVNDMSTAMLMAKFYDLWLDEHLSPPHALRQAQIWLRDSTVEDLLLQFKDCMQSGSVRMSAEAAKFFYKNDRIAWGDPNDRPFKDPFWWAAFAYTGL